MDSLQFNDAEQIAIAERLCKASWKTLVFIYDTPMQSVPEDYAIHGHWIRRKRFENKSQVTLYTLPF